MRMEKKGPKNKKEKVTIFKAFSNNFFLLRLCFQASPSRVIGNSLSYICGYLKTLFFGIVFWEVLLGYVEEGVSFQEVIPFLVFTVVLVFTLDLILHINNSIIAPSGNQELYEKMHIRMFEKACDAELECFENPEFYNKYMKAVTQIKSRAHTVLWVMTRFLVSIPAMMYLVYKMICIDPVSMVFSVIPFFCNYFIGKRINRLNYELYQKIITSDRRKEYVKRVIYQQDYAKELRLSNGFLLLIDMFRQSLDSVKSNIKEYGFKIGLWACLIQGFDQVFVMAGSILYASVRLLYFKNLQIGEYVVLVNAVAQLSSHLYENAHNLTRILENSPYIENIRAFYDYEPKIAQSQPGKAVDGDELLLNVENVSFSYFGQEKEVLKNVSLSIHKNEKIVLVGENGAGKSTLVKLLMRLYDPTEGRLTLNGSDIKEYAVSQYRNLFGTVFQDFKLFSLTVAENVLMRRMKEEDRETVETALKYSGVYDKVMKLPNGIETMLTREFDPEGAVLSGGEQQKIAIARVFARDCQIAILDEPSSALDPIAEYEMYESMLKACENKAVVFISHRLSSAVLADKIYMLEKGRVIESGSHEELMRKNGKYAEMFRFQAENYVS